MRDELLSSINFTSSQDERGFYARFVALKLKGLTEGGPLRTEVVNRLQELVVGDEDGQDVLLAILRREALTGSAPSWSRRPFDRRTRQTYRTICCAWRQVLGSLWAVFSLARKASSYSDPIIDRSAHRQHDSAGGRGCKLAEAAGRS
jgi:hypothetical protein